MNFINYRQLREDVIRLSQIIDRDYDLIVGIPRSGMIPASMLSFLLHKPCGSVFDLLNMSNVFYSIRMSRIKKEIKKVLVVDDCIGGGNSIKKTRELLSSLKNIKIDYCCVYSTQPNDPRVDFVVKQIPFPRLFEWNMFNCDGISSAFLDIDGVICNDPTFTETNEEQMRNHILNATPLYIPTYKVRGFITSRLEKFRKETEQYLKRYNIDYGVLYMSPFNSPEERRKAARNGQIKGEVCKKHQAKLFIESNLGAAKIIKSVANIPVICTDTMELVKL